MLENRAPQTSTLALRASFQSRPWWRLGGHLGLVLVILLVVILTSIGSDAFLSANNLLNVLRQVSVMAVLAAGLTVLMISGGIDFSMGSNAVVTMSVVAQLSAAGWPAWAAVVVGIVCATLFGFINGLVVTLTAVAPFVATLATATILDGTALLIIDGMSVSAPGPLTTFGLGSVFGLPALLLVAAGVCIILGVALRRTMVGRNVFAIGGNETVARLSGIPVARTKILLYALTGLLAGIAGVLLLSRLGAASPGVTGLTIELQAVAAVVIGGTALSGGRGTMLGTVLGVLLIGLVSNSLNLLGVSAYFQIMAVGAVLLIAALANAGRRAH